MIASMMLVGLALSAGAAKDQPPTISVGEVEPTVCAYQGPLARKGVECKKVLLETDPKSATGYRIPGDLKSAFGALNRITSGELTDSLISMYKQDVGSDACHTDRKCAGQITLDLADLLQDAWGIEKCSPLAKDLIQHGVSPAKGAMDLILMSYRDLIIAPDTDGVFRRYLRTEEAQPSVSAVYKFLIDRGYSTTAVPTACK